MNFRYFVFTALLVACSGASDDSTNPDASSDAVADTTTSDAGADASSNDASSNDAAADAPADVDQGNLDGGDTCDPKNDQCGNGLKCCAGGISSLDGGSGHCVTPTDAGTCPFLP